MSFNPCSSLCGTSASCSGQKISFDLHESLRVVIQTVNKIKSHSKYDRLFRKFCIDTEQEHVRLILHTEFRWLSKGNCLARFVKLFDTIVNFLKNLKENNFAKEIKFHKCDIGGFFVSSMKCHFSFKVNYVHCWIVNVF